MKNCLLACMMLSLCSFGAGDEAWLSLIRRDHPRMFFNRDTWSAVKARALGEQRQVFETMLRSVENYPMDPVCSGYDPMVFGEVKTASGTHKITAATPINSVRDWGPEAAQCAFVWRVTGNPIFLEKARKMIEVSAAAYRMAIKNGRAVNWYSTNRVLALAAYDWIYEGLDDAQRKPLITELVAHVEEVQPGPGKPKIIRLNSSGVVTGFYGVQNMLWFSGLAAYGDGYCDELALKHLRRGYELNQKLLEYRSRSAGDDGGLSSGVDGYCMGAYPWSHFNFFHTYLSATGVNVAKDWPSMALFPNWIYWLWIPVRGSNAALTFGFGDCQHVTNEMNIGTVYEHMSQYMHFFKDADPEAARLAASLRSLVNKRTPGWVVLPFILGSGDDVQPYTEQELQHTPLKARHFESLGQVVMRSDWTPEGTYCLFTSGAEMTQHKHLDENNFVIYKQGFLALDSGTRGRETDYNLRHYYAQTVAHNCILIHQPGEPLAPYWGMREDSPEGKLNHGGMITPKGKTLAFETNDLFTYVAGDASNAYGKKGKEAVRQFIHLQPDYFVVYDRVAASDPNYRKEWLLHTQNQPIINGKTLMADENKGRLFCESLLPKDAKLTLVGGSGKEFWASGKNWEVDSAWLERTVNNLAKSGREPLFGKWRLEVSPGEARVDDRFLHVLTACVQTVEAGIPAKLLESPDQDGVELQLPGKTIEVWFNRTGEVGGKIVVRGGKTYELRKDIQPQAGVKIVP